MINKFIKNQQKYYSKRKILKKYQALYLYQKNNFLHSLANSTKKKIINLKKVLLNFVQEWIFYYKFYTFIYKQYYLKTKYLGTKQFLKKIYTKRAKPFQLLFENSAIQTYKTFIKENVKYRRNKYITAEFCMLFFKKCKLTL